MRIGNKEFNTKTDVYIMGILNVTPDSFSDGGLHMKMDDAMLATERMIKEGAAIIDVGGESTRPGYQKVTIQEEIDRVAPVIEKIRHNWDIPISLDTYKPAVAKEGIAAGADLINDIWGLKAEGDMASLIAEAGLPCVLMHNRREEYKKDFLTEFMEDLQESLDLAKKAGIPKEKIILDPGIGFAKDAAGSRKVTGHLEMMQDLGCPVLYAASRKSMIGNTLDLPTDQRLEGTLATTAVAVLKGASFVRVHDVKENLRAAKMALAIREEV
ncbi:MAG: dihydropteroate synthase [Lachnospiraceae bacterium]|nr:dihydropteroate synthase [Lachnospiraceae bacterium]